MIVPVVYVHDDTAYTDFDRTRSVSKELSLIEVFDTFENNGADAVVFYDMSYDDASHEKAIGYLRSICKNLNIPVYATGNIKRVEDVKKYLYAGARSALIETGKASNLDILSETTQRFGADKVGIFMEEYNSVAAQMIVQNGNSVVFAGVDAIRSGVKAVALTDKLIIELLADSGCTGLAAKEFCDDACDMMEIKNAMRSAGISANIFTSSIPFSQFKLNSDGLIPVVVQDYATDEVLMLAYMNEESYNATIETGRMTYYSRSRQELWVKGLTSGHYQYVMSLSLDCDNDTILAKVRQIGAACHTGAHSCFFKELCAKDVAKTNPLKVFNDVMDVIIDRKNNPKEGSYTNYLFDKGIDKILKKVGEEATEIVIAAKNPDPVEVKYEIADFLYHVMVLMAERGLDWEDITEELANR